MRSTPPNKSMKRTALRGTADAIRFSRPHGTSGRYDGHVSKDCRVIGSDLRGAVGRNSPRLSAS